VPVAAHEAPAIDIAWTTRAVAEPRSLREDSVFATGLPLTSFGRDRCASSRRRAASLGRSTCWRR
jgi:hypothetical protein